MRRACQLGAAVIMVVGSLVAVGVAAAGPGRVVMHEGFLYRPHEFPVSGDGDYVVQGLTWRSWGGNTAVAYGRAVEQERPSHVDYTYPVRVTLSRRTYCTNLHRTVYEKISARILGRSAGVFGLRIAGRLYTCAGTWQLTG